MIREGKGGFRRGFGLLTTLLDLKLSSKYTITSLYKSLYIILVQFLIFTAKKVIKDSFSGGKGFPRGHRTTLVKFYGASICSKIRDKTAPLT